MFFFSFFHFPLELLLTPSISIPISDNEVFLGIIQDKGHSHNNSTNGSKTQDILWTHSQREDETESENRTEGEIESENRFESESESESDKGLVYNQSGVIASWTEHNVSFDINNSGMDLNLTLEETSDSEDSSLMNDTAGLDVSSSSDNVTANPLESHMILNDDIDLLRQFLARQNGSDDQDISSWNWNSE